ncbi:sterol desaturase family protein [Halpernia frigidisoli]|uniref:Sterol desaturase/sphingolipid hydroxylase, fatty acid hydroxylase superfamily n=1 Tax=Halpernia frigidisoli TaxID=1125876 RepID=A0A1I3DYK3_9FLAO|nr:sterol desaturase family protein [Halpernia frigidisoli]SFH91689.1 Sterol desaturase/sphingolipid hydroxylase, fatty acid hydroxylase superfamily [Halpernia frigidisoli]
MSFFLGEDGLQNVYTWAIPFHATVILGEMIYSHVSESKLYNNKDIVQNIFLALGNFSIDLAMKVVTMAVMFFFYSYRIFNWEFTWYYWIICFVVTDLAYWVLHYMDHHSRAFWAVHITHHNSEYFNLTTGFRSSVLEPLYRYLYFAPLAFLGFNPWHILVVYAVGQVYGTWVHTQTVKKMGFLEHILITPSHHRVHHACNIKYLDRNMGMVFVFWDKMFGTFEKEDDLVPVKYGIYPKMPDDKPLTIFAYEWRNIWKDIKQPDLKLTDKFNYIFNSPGWKHDGTGKTVRQYQKEYLAKKLFKEKNQSI